MSTAINKLASNATSKLSHLPAGSCATADIALAREWHAAPPWQRAAARRARVRANRAPAWLRALFVTEPLVQEAFSRARVIG